MNIVNWPHKDLLDVTQLSLAEIEFLLDKAEKFYLLNNSPSKKKPILSGKGVVLFFAESSTRTKTSFDVAGKRLGADTFSLGVEGSSIKKGESLKDTALTLEAMKQDVIVVRHSASGAAAYLANLLSCPVVNAGDGWHAHPTQALLDAFTLRAQWEGRFEGKIITIIGDVAHSRVARSNVQLLTRLGVKVRIFAPKTLLPPGIEHWPVSVCRDMQEAVSDVDAVMCLRLQLERQAAGLLPHMAEYASKFCLTSQHMALAKPEALILHPGPVNQGLEISSNLVYSMQSRILDQVNAGVAVRMAVLHTLMTREPAEDKPLSRPVFRKEN